MPRRRVWESYLTESDIAHVAARPVSTHGGGHSPALLLIDLYRKVFGDRPEPLLESIKRWPSSCGLAAWEALPHLQRLLASAREARVPVIHTKGSTALPRRVYSASVRFEDSVDGRRLGYELLPELAPMRGEIILEKAAPSAFWGTPLHGLLTQLGIDTLVIGGESTSGCVRASVVDAQSNRFRTLVVEECVFDRHEASHAISLFDMHRKYADVISLAEAIEYLRKEPAGTG